MNFGSTPCWNGPNCYYLKNNRCRFYHPPSDLKNIQNVRSSIHFEEIQEKDELKNILSDFLKFNNPQLKQQKEKEKKKQMLTELMIKDKKIPLLNLDTFQISDVKKKWFFKHVPHFKYYAGCHFDECSICLQKFEELENQTLTYLFCQHVFHTKCIEKWIISHDSCPLCKRKFSQHKQFQQFAGYSEIKTKYNNILLPDFLNYWNHDHLINDGSFELDYYDEGYHHDSFDSFDNYAEDHYDYQDNSISENQDFSF